MRLLRRLNALLASFEIVGITVFLLVLFVANAYALVARYLFNSYPPWIIEVSEMLMISLVFLGGAWLYREGRQIAVLALVGALRPGGLPARILRTSGDWCVLAFAILTIWQAVRYQPILAQSTTPVLGVPKYLTTVMVLVAYISIALASIERLLGSREAVG